MSNSVTIFTYDWVPEMVRGFVRDVRLRWACEEAGIEYEVESVPFKDRGEEHFANQPFGQVPFIQDGDITLFESGACLLHLARKSDKLMPRDPKGEAETLQWTIAALNSMEMVTVPWWFLTFSLGPNNPLEPWKLKRLEHLNAVLEKREWLAANRFTVADLLMADVLRVPKLFDKNSFVALHSYVERLTARPAFKKAREEQVAHFSKADK